MKKRFSAFLLAALMVAALLPTMSFATTTTVNTIADLKTALASAQSGDVIILGCDMEAQDSDLNNVDLWVALKITAGVTLDGAGHTFTVPNTGSYIGDAVFYGEDDFTIRNITIHCTGSGTRALEMYGNGGVASNMTVTGAFAYGIYAAGQVTVENCTFSNAKAGEVWGVYNDTDDSTLTISGCTFNTPRAALLYGDGTFSENTVNSAMGVSVWQTSSAELSDNTFTGDRAVENYSTDMTFTGNNLTSETKFESTVNVTLSGNYWGQAGGPSASQLTGNTGTVTDSAPLASDPTIPAYAGPVMNWVKVNAANNGVVKSGPLAASAGATVTLYPKAAEGYVLDTVEVLDAEGNAVELDGLKFAIPAGGVTVNATFKPAE